MPTQLGPSIYRCSRCGISTLHSYHSLRPPSTSFWLIPIRRASSWRSDRNFDQDLPRIANPHQVNSPRFPIVSKMAKDILCIQVSTVASESAFSASGRVLDPYRNSLAPSIVEALVCTQDWIRTSSRNITLDTLEDLMKDDEVAKEIQEALEKQKGEHENSRMS